MSLQLDKRQRAMLREMGVRVWSPMAAVEAAPVAVPASPPNLQPAAALAEAEVHAAVAVDAIAARARSTRPAVPVAAAPAIHSRPAPAAAGDSAVWRMGEALALYADTATAGGPRWLVLAETPESSMQGGFKPFEGDAGKLLDNMLRAARLHMAGSVMLAPLSRQAGGTSAAASLPALISNAAPDLILVMGRLASQALLQSTEPFGRLRGQVHSLHGAKLVVTLDAPYLLRNTLDKAKAWDDMCLALSVITRP